jgi:hypothetical protein
VSSASTNRWTPAARAPGVSVAGMMCSASVATSSDCAAVSVPAAERSAVVAAAHSSPSPDSTPDTVDAERTPPRIKPARRSASRRVMSSLMLVWWCAPGRTVRRVTGGVTLPGA